MLQVICLAVLVGLASAAPDKRDGIRWDLKFRDPRLIPFINGAHTTWTAGENERWVNVESDVIEGMMGARDDPANDLSTKDPNEDTVSVPSTFDARLAWPHCAQVIGNIRDQSECGSCWAEGAVEAMSDRICIKSMGQLKLALSTDHLMSCCFTCGMGCNGGYPSAAWKFYQTDGIVTGGNHTNMQGCQPYPFPPCEHHIHPAHPHYPACPKTIYKTPHCSHECQASYHKQFNEDKHFAEKVYNVQADVKAIQKEIAAHGPVEATFSVYADFLTYKHGVYQHKAGPMLGGHAVKILGWGEESGTPYWLVANSWNTDWGMHGYFKILRGHNECGIEGGISAGIPK